MNRQGGFSFIEILVVMGIIGVLVGGVIVAIGIFFKKGPEFDTKNTLSKTRMLIEKWRMEFDGAYPPGEVTRLSAVTGVGEVAKDAGNKTNAGIESVYQAMYWPGFKSDPQFSPNELGNTDEDELRKAINKLGTTALTEVVDGWGNPLVYFHKDDYAKFGESGAGYVSQSPDGGELLVEARPYRSADGTYINPTSFQLYSMGPDGEPNTDDDITTWGN